MESSESITLLQAVGFYASNTKLDGNQEQVHRELSRFVQWCGRDRVLSDVKPSEVGEYADQVSGSGTSPQAAERLQALRSFLTFVKKKGFVNRNLATHVRIHKFRSTSIRTQLVDAPDVTQITADGHGQLLTQLEKLKAERAPIALQIRNAAADKDVRENVPLEAAREQLGHVESQIRNIEHTLKFAVIVDDASHETVPVAKVGTRVSVKDLDRGRETTYMLVSRTETNPLKGKISDVSPLGQALLGRSAGQEVEVDTPRGKTRYRILKVSS